MSSRRHISWSAAMRSIEQDRTPLSPVRELPLRSAGRADGSGKLTAWRGLSGRRYVATILHLTREDAFDAAAGVALAVHRDGKGHATIVAARACPVRDPGYLGWLAACCQRGATELHIHTLAEGEDGRKAVAADLTARAPAAGRTSVRGAAA